MIEISDLETGVDTGIITAEQRDALLEFARLRSQTGASADEEQFRFITGFNDIFVTIACVLLLVSIGTLGERVFMNARGWGPGVAITSWALAEYFTRVRRMALPSIVLLLAFVVSLVAFGFELLREFPIGDEPGTMTLVRTVFAATLGVSAAALHWWRFKVPITIAAGAAAAVALLSTAATFGFVSAGIDQSWLQTIFLNVTLVGGLGVFALAMRFDMSDRERITRRTDVAFWLHLLAAPLIVHPVFVMLGFFNGAMSTVQAVAAVVIYFGLTFVALAIDRRALLVSSLTYVVYAIFSLFRRAEAADLQVALTCLVIGLFLVMLSATWRQIRRQVIQFVPELLRARLPAS